MKGACLLFKVNGCVSSGAVDIPFDCRARGRRLIPGAGPILQILK